LLSFHWTLSVQKFEVCNPVEEVLKIGKHDEIEKLAFFDLIMAAQTSVAF